MQSTGISTIILVGIHTSCQNNLGIDNRMTLKRIENNSGIIGYLCYKLTFVA